MLLPSIELKELSKEVDVILSGKKTPAGCDIRFRQMYWMMVYDAAGELRDAGDMSPRLTAGRKLGFSVPEAFVDLVRAGLGVEHSLEELERQYITERGAETSYLALREKIDELSGVGQMRVAAFLHESAPQTEDPGLSRARGIFVEAAACDHQVINHGAYAKLRKSIEDFLVAHPNHPACKDIIVPLGGIALKYSFDLSAKCEAYARDWTGRRDLPDKAQASLAALAHQLLAYRDAELTRMEQWLQSEGEEAYGAQRFQARLGLAQKTLDRLDNGTSFGVFRPIHAEWRVEATAQLESSRAQEAGSVPADVGSRSSLPGAQ